MIPQNLNDRGIHGNDGMFPSHLTSGVTKDRFMNDSLISFFVNCNLKTLSQKWKKSLKMVHFHEKASSNATL